MPEPHKLAGSVSIGACQPARRTQDPSSPVRVLHRYSLCLLPTHTPPHPPHIPKTPPPHPAPTLALSRCPTTEHPTIFKLTPPPHRIADSNQAIRIKQREWHSRESEFTRNLGLLHAVHIPAEKYLFSKTKTEPTHLTAARPEHFSFSCLPCKRPCWE